jgi:hypothetical protein
MALALASNSASLHHVLGFVLYFAGRVSEAIASIQKASRSIRHSHRR